MATQPICIWGYSYLEIRALAFKLPCRPNERSKIIYGWLEKASYSLRSLCCQCYWWNQQTGFCCTRLNHSPLAYCPKKRPFITKFYDGRHFPQILLEFLEPCAEECWLVWHTCSLDVMSSNSNFTLSIQWCIVKVIHRKKKRRKTKSPRNDIMTCVFFSNIHVCTFFQERSCSGGAISEMWPWKDWDPSTSTAGWANGAT